MRKHKFKIPEDVIVYFVFIFGLCFLLFAPLWLFFFLIFIYGLFMTIFACSEAESAPGAVVIIFIGLFWEFIIIYGIFSEFNN